MALPNNGNEFEAEPSKFTKGSSLGKKRGWGEWLLKEEKKDLKGVLREKLRARAINDEEKKNKPTYPLANQSLRHSVSSF